MGDKKERPKIEDVLDAVPTTCLVSGGEWTGVPLAELLNLAGLKKGAQSIHCVGYDRGRPDPTPQYAATGRTDIEVHDPGIINYDKALPLEKALHPDTLLVWAMNGEYLQHIHGAPLRLVVPGWSGNWSVKWLKEINVLDRFRIAKNFIVAAAHVAAEKEPKTSRPFLHVEHDLGGTKNVSCIAKGECHAIRDGHGPIVIEGHELFHGALRVFHAVKRLDGW